MVYRPKASSVGEAKLALKLVL